MPADQAIGDHGNVVFSVIDESSHEIYSGPHPAHTDCPALNIGALGPRAIKSSSELRTGVCEFHDDLNLDDPRFQGTIRVQ